MLHFGKIGIVTINNFKVGKLYMNLIELNIRNLTLMSYFYCKNTHIVIFIKTLIKGSLQNEYVRKESLKVHGFCVFNLFAWENGVSFKYVCMIARMLLFIVIGS